jgi:hypothetical protein
MLYFTEDEPVLRIRTFMATLTTLASFPVHPTNGAGTPGFG